MAWEVAHVERERGLETEVLWRDFSSTSRNAAEASFS
jgi:hypothetical protein